MLYCAGTRGHSARWAHPGGPWHLSIHQHLRFAWVPPKLPRCREEEGPLLGRLSDWLSGALGEGVWSSPGGEGRSGHCSYYRRRQHSRSHRSLGHWASRAEQRLSGSGTPYWACSVPYRCLAVKQRPPHLTLCMVFR